MTNTNCLEGVACPKCKQDGHFMIAATMLANVTDGGASYEGGDISWDETALCICPECNHEAKLYDFTVENWDKEDEKLSFVRTIARMTKHGEEVDGEEFNMTGEDAIFTVNSLIDKARNILERG